MNAQKLNTIIELRLGFLAIEFPKLSGRQCSELLKYEIECLKKVIEEAAKLSE